MLKIGIHRNGEGFFSWDLKHCLKTQQNTLLELTHNSLRIGNIFNFHNAIILIKSVTNENKNNYCYNISLEKSLYKDKPNTQYF